MSQQEKKKIAGQQKAIKEHEQKRKTYSEPYEKEFAQKTIDNAQRHLDKLRGKKK
jgi:hypothetical protein